MLTILVPTDFTSFATDAARIAIKLAVEKHCSIEFHHVAETLIEWDDLGFLSSRPDVFPSNAQENLLPELKVAMEAMKAKLDALVKQAEEAGVPASGTIGYGSVYGSVADRLQKHDNTLVVMGSHGASGFKEVFLGSNTQRVIRQAPNAVMVVREGQEAIEVNHLVFASDFEEDSISSNLEKVKRWADFFAARIHLLFVNTPGRFQSSAESLERLDQVAQEAGLTDHSMHVYNDYTVEYGIVAFSRQIKADLVVMAPHGYEGFQRIMHNNITETIVNQSEFAVLALGNPRK